MGKLIEAHGCFEKILVLAPVYLKAYENLENVRARLVNRWHLEMLNDMDRNMRYKKALSKAIKQRHQTSVLNINTGNGLMAIYAHESGAKQTFASERSPLMCHIATEAFKRNNCEDRIRMLPKPSIEIDAKADLGGEVDLVVTEFMDCAVLAEGVIDSLIHAKENLLKTGGLIIPCRLKLFVAAFESEQIAADLNMIYEGTFTDTLYVPNTSLSAIRTEQYVACRVDQVSDFTLVTNYAEALNVNLNSLDDLYALQNGTMSAEVKLIYTAPDVILDGLVVWYEVSLDSDETIKLSSNPFEHDPDGGERHSQLEVAVFRLNHRYYEPLPIKTYFTVKMSSMNGIIKLEHELESEARVFTGITSEMARFINDVELLSTIEYEVFQEIGVRFPVDRPNVDSVADFLPFPTVGMAMLKEKRLVTLYCSREAQDVVTFLAETNPIDMKQVVFLDGPSDLLMVDTKFDVILLSLVESYGTIQSSHIAIYEKLKQTKLSEKGFMVPERLEIWAHTIGSTWLRSLVRVHEPEIKDRLRIGQLVNEYATTLHYDLSQTFDYFRWFRTYRLAEVPLNGEFFETLHKMYVGKKKRFHGRDPLAVLFYFTITLTVTSDSPISTRSKRRGSFWKLSCFVFDENNVKRKFGLATVRYRQNYGIMQIDVQGEEEDS